MTDLAIVLPGRGYTAQGPVIRLPILAAEQAGFTPVVVEYPRDALAARDFPIVVDSVRQQIAQAFDVHGVGRVAVVAKSLGTQVLVQVAERLGAADAISVVWVTPLFGEAEVRNGAIALGWRSLVVCGEVDPFHDETGTGQVASATGADVVTLAGADHALEVAGDVEATAGGLQTVAGCVLGFLGD